MLLGHKLINYAKMLIRYSKFTVLWPKKCLDYLLMDFNCMLCYFRSSTVDSLNEWCKRMAIPAPTFDYQPGRDNKQRAIVTLADGQVFHGSYARGVGQAAESAAGMALLHLVS
jgi:hypothetical protein